MNDYGAVEAAIAKLATALRRSQEDFFRAQELMKVDREEAINNLDAAFEAKIEAFLSLYGRLQGPLRLPRPSRHRAGDRAEECDPSSQPPALPHLAGLSLPR